MSNPTFPSLLLSDLSFSLYCINAHKNAQPSKVTPLCYRRQSPDFVQTSIFETLVFLECFYCILGLQHASLVKNYLGRTEEKSVDGK